MNVELRITLGCILLASACSDGGSSDADGGKGLDASTVDAAPLPPDAMPDAMVPLIDCNALTALPVTPTVLTGFSGSEDFAFDAEGNLVSNDGGNITKQTKAGVSTLLSPNVGETAGMRYLSTGELVVAQVDNGLILRIATNGASSTLLAGFAYPNGIEVDKDDFVYVAEHDAGRVRRVNSATGEFTIIAEGLTNPNGLSFSPDYKTLHINSFGGGTVHTVTVDEAGNWSAPALLGSVPANGFDSGGLDGMAVDACGNAYVTEYVQGIIWRFTPEGVKEMVVDLPSFWIPNLHWGTGVGGWDPKVLYVMDREEGRVFELPVNIEEKELVYP